MIHSLVYVIKLYGNMISILPLSTLRKPADARMLELISV